MRKLAGLQSLRLIAKLSMLLSLFSILSLFLLFRLVDTGSSNYIDIISMLWETRSNLLLFVFIAGAFVLSLVAITTWLLCLYASFRIAGPLYRLQIQLGLATTDAKSKFTGLRKNDLLLLKLVYRETREAIREENKLKGRLYKKICYIDNELAQGNVNTIDKEISLLKRKLEIIILNDL